MELDIRISFFLVDVVRYFQMEGVVWFHLCRLACSGDEHLEWIDIEPTRWTAQHVYLVATEGVECSDLVSFHRIITDKMA